MSVLCPLCQEPFVTLEGHVCRKALEVIVELRDKVKRLEDQIAALDGAVVRREIRIPGTLEHVELGAATIDALAQSSSLERGGSKSKP